MDEAARADGDEPHERGGEVRRVRRPPPLVVDDLQLLAPRVREAEDRVDEVDAPRREDPRGPHDEDLGAAREGAPLAPELAAAVGVHRVDRVVLAPGPARPAVEDVVRRDVDEERPGLAAEAGHLADGDVVDGEVRGVALAEVDAGVRRGVPDDGHARDDRPREAGGIGDVELVDAERARLRPETREAAREHPAGAEDQLRHAGLLPARRSA